MAISSHLNLSNPSYTQQYSTSDNNMVKVEITGLEDDRLYFYGVMIDDQLQGNGRGQFKTFPKGASSFRFGFASCASTGSTHEVFDVIRNSNLDFFIHMGDIHYSHPSSIATFHTYMDNVFSSDRQHRLYSQMPQAYVWDDHDYGSNNADGTYGARADVWAGYRQRVPHYNLPSGDFGGIYQSFVCGRVRMILLDARSERLPLQNEMISETQMQWLFTELLKPEVVKVVSIGVPWIGTTGSDTWAGFPEQRRRIANFIKQNNLVNNVIMIAGDMHGLAIDDGTNSDYADGGGGGIPVFQAAQLDRQASVKGGPWRWGPWTSEAGGQFGIIEITDTGGSSIMATLRARRMGTVLHTYTKNIPVFPTVQVPEVTNLRVTANTHDAVTIAWNPVSGASSYIIEQNGNHVTQISNTSYTVEGLEPETEYQFTVRTVVNSNSSAGTTISATTLSAPSSGVFDIYSVGGKEIWLDPMAETNEIVGNFIVKADDLSGKGRHGVPLVGSFPVITKDGKKFIETGGGKTFGHDVFSTPFDTTIGGYSLFLIMQYGELTGSQRSIDLLNSGNTVLTIHKGSNNTLEIMGSNTITLTPDDIGRTFLVSAVRNSSIGLTGIYINGINQTFVSSGVGGMVNRYYYGQRFSIGQPHRGLLGEFLLINKPLSGAELDNVHQYLIEKWGVS